METRQAKHPTLTQEQVEACVPLMRAIDALVRNVVLMDDGGLTENAVGHALQLFHTNGRKDVDDNLVLLGDSLAQAIQCQVDTMRHALRSAIVKEVCDVACLTWHDDEGETST